MGPPDVLHERQTLDGMIDSSSPSRYAEAFWRVLPIPVVLVGLAVLVFRHRPSGAVLLALAILTLVALGLEALIMWELRRRWLGEPPGALGRAIEALSRQTLLWTALCLAWFAIASSPLLYLVKGRSLGMSLLQTTVTTCVFMALVVGLAAVIERLRG